LLNIGLADQEDSLYFTDHQDTINHVSYDNTGIKVQVKKLDSIVNESQIPALIKIDVEGFEYPVLSGAKNTLENIGVKAIIIELNGLGQKYGYLDNQIDELLQSYEFKAYHYFPFQRELNLMENGYLGKYSNIIYCRDLPFVRNRLATAPNIKINKFSY
jgi:hypothetical protein